MERRTEIITLDTTQVSRLIQSALPGVEPQGFELLSGGRANTNYRVELPDGPVVLRLYTREPATRLKEALLYGLLDDIPVPTVIAHGDDEIGAFALLQFMPGQRLIDAGVTPEIGRQLGRILGRMNKRKFDRLADLGVVDGKLAAVDWDFLPDDATDPAEAFHRWVLFESLAKERLGTELRDAVWKILQSAPDNEEQPHLVHADFNATNILVDDGRVTAILDWEFAHAGSIYSDLGNLFRQRPECPLPEGFAKEVIAGLKEEGVNLPSDWRKQALVTDLSSALEFLSSRQDRPKTHARAREQVVETLKLL